MKYEKHIRLLLGTTSVLLPDETLEGRRAISEEYTDQWVCMNSIFLVHCRTEVARVRALPCDGALWVLGHRPKNGGIFEEDDICKLDGIDKGTTKKLSTSVRSS